MRDFAIGLAMVWLAGTNQGPQGYWNLTTWRATATHFYFAPPAALIGDKVPVPEPRVMELMWEPDWQVVVLNMFVFPSPRTGSRIVGRVLECKERQARVERGETEAWIVRIAVPLGSVPRHPSVEEVQIAMKDKAIEGMGFIMELSDGGMVQSATQSHEYEKQAAWDAQDIFKTHSIFLLYPQMGIEAEPFTYWK